MHALLASLLLAIAPALEIPEPPVPELARAPRTVAESSGYRATSRHADVLAFCRWLDDASEKVTLGELGRSHEGRSIPLLIVSDRPVAEAGQARDGGRIVVLLIGAIHGGEVAGKEALLAFARDIALAPSHPLLERLVLAIVPLYNPDGNERISHKNRPGQVGPQEGAGERSNAQGLDLNRDYVKLEAPETRALVRFLNEWDPEVIIDTHTTNGSRHRYALTYQGPKNPAGDARVIEYVRDRMLPRVSEDLRERHGLATFFYGNFREAHTRWETYPALARYGTPYRGLRNRLAILAEAYAYDSYEVRVRSTRAFVAACLRDASTRRDEIARLVRDADRRTVELGTAAPGGDRIAVRSRAEPFDQPVVVAGFDPTESGASGEERTGERPRDYSVHLVNNFVAVETVERPRAYLVPPALRGVVENLRSHGIRLEELREDITLEVEEYKVTEVSRANEPFEGHRLTSAGVTPSRRKVMVPRGTLVVPCAQPLGSLAAYLLEPRSEDGLVSWNFFDGALEAGRLFPVLRLAGRTPILTRELEGSRGASPSGKKLLTYAALYEAEHPPKLGGSPARIARWLPDGEHYLQVKNERVWKVTARTGETVEFGDREAMAAALAALPEIGEEEAKRIAGRTSFQMDGSATAALIEHGNDLYYLTFDGRTARRLTRTPEEEEVATFSPDGRFVAFVRGYDLFVADVASGSERALTSGGNETLRNGKAEWVYFEEVFDRDWKAYWWSPDSRRIAFLRTESSHVPEFTLADDIPEDQRVETARFPKPGDPNPHVELGVVPVAGGGVSWLDLSAYDAPDFLITRVGWWPKGDKLYFFVQNRVQTWLDLLAAPSRGGKPDRLFRETTQAWVDIPPPLEFLADGSFLFLSARSGWSHLYRYSSDGNLAGAVTSGEWEVRRLHELDEEAGWAYLSGTRDSHIAENLYRARLDGSAIERLTRERGSHRVQVAPQGKYAIDSWSSLECPPRVALLGADGAPVRQLDTNPVPVLEEYHVGIPRLVEIEMPHGVTLAATVLEPPGFDPSRRYPVWFMTYGGPHAPSVRDAWSGGHDWDQALAAAGVVVFRFDPESASGRGAVSAWRAYRKLGVEELEDIVVAVEWLKSQPWVDGTRIGMSGYSYGGFLTAYALTHSKLFRAGFSGAPVTDWRDYDSIYTERYMGLPQDNPDGYAATSVAGAAADLDGRLLLVHGTMDDNVHFQNTLRFVRELQRAGKQFDLMVYPGSRHAIWGPHIRRLRYDFILEHLEPAPATVPTSTEAVREF